MFRRHFHSMLAAALLASAVGATAGTVDTTEVATKDALLTVSANGAVTLFDRNDLQAFPVTQIETTTIWTEGNQVFEGVLLKDMLDSLEITEGEIHAIAINDYSVSIPVADVNEDGPIVAYLQNGKEMSRRGKGPLWIVYPYDNSPDFQTETVYSRSIWQLDRLTAE